MPENNPSLHKRIKKFSKYLSVKVKETTERVLYRDDENKDEIEQDNQPSKEKERNSGGSSNSAIDQIQELLVRRHSSYVQRPPVTMGKSESMFYDQELSTELEKEQGHTSTFFMQTTAAETSLPVNTTRAIEQDQSAIIIHKTNSALSPPPRQSRCKSVSNNSKEYQTILSKPCLSRSSTLGRNSTSAAPSSEEIAAPIIVNHSSLSLSSSPSTSSLSSLTGQPRCNINQKQSLHIDSN